MILRSYSASSPVLEQLDLAAVLAVECHVDANSTFGFRAACVQGGKTLQPKQWRMARCSSVLALFLVNLQCFNCVVLVLTFLKGRAPSRPEEMALTRSSCPATELFALSYDSVVM